MLKNSQIRVGKQVLQYATLSYAQEIINLLTLPAHQFGYMIALYGSVLTKGCGRDIDILFMPKLKHTASAPKIYIEDMIRQLNEKIIKAKEVSAPYHGILNTYSVQMITQDNIILDIQVGGIQDRLFNSEYTII